MPVESRCDSICPRLRVADKLGCDEGGSIRPAAVHTMLTIAHRGASALYPENTLCAFLAAADLGADMCEFDVRMTRDGEVVVIHDATVNRTTDGRGRVAEMNAAAIKRLDAGVRFGGEFRGERIPTLAEVAAALGGRCSMDVELKAVGLEHRVCGILRESGAIESAIVSSFDWDQLKIVAAQEPELRVALLGEKAPASLLEAASAMRAYAIAPRFDIASAELCAEAHRRGLAVYVWTVDDVLTMRRLMAAGVDGIMTNHPERLRELVAN
jgi:glycerophosphoryl diester phosphodiesterase